jgi:hypothetical protein
LICPNTKQVQISESKICVKTDNQGSKGTREFPLNFEFFKENDEIFRSQSNITQSASVSSLRGSFPALSLILKVNHLKKKTRMEKQI